MPHFEDLPDLWRGSANPYGIPVVPLFGVEGGVTPGGSSMGAGAPVWWIQPGSGLRPDAMRGRGMSGWVPGMGDDPSGEPLGPVSVDAAMSQVAMIPSTSFNFDTSASIQPFVAPTGIQSLVMTLPDAPATASGGLQPFVMTLPDAPAPSTFDASQVQMTLPEPSAATSVPGASFSPGSVVMPAMVPAPSPVLAQASSSFSADHVAGNGQWVDASGRNAFGQQLEAPSSGSTAQGISSLITGVTSLGAKVAPGIVAASLPGPRTPSYSTLVPGAQPVQRQAASPTLAQRAKSAGPYVLGALGLGALAVGIGAVARRKG